MKPRYPRDLVGVVDVAPHAGAWIETHGLPEFRENGFGRPPRGGVD